MLNRAAYIKVFALALILFLGMALSSRNYFNFFKLPFLKAPATIAGESAQNCGVALLQESKQRINECVINAFSSRSSFYAIYYLQGVDSFPVEAFAYNGSELYSLTYDMQIWERDAGMKGITGYRKKECSDPRPRELVGIILSRTHPFVCHEA